MRGANEIEKLRHDWDVDRGEKGAAAQSGCFSHPLYFKNVDDVTVKKGAEGGGGDVCMSSALVGNVMTENKKLR